MIGAVFLLCLRGFTIMEMEFQRIRQSIERTERRTKNLQRQFAALHFIEANRSTKRCRRSLQVNAVYKCSQYDTMFTQFMFTLCFKSWWVRAFSYAFSQSAYTYITDRS